MTKISSKALEGSGKSEAVVEHEALRVKGDVLTALADTSVTSTVFSSEGNYIVKDTTNGDSATVSIINTGGTLSAVKVNGSTGITITADTASSVNVYVLAGVLAVQNLTGGAIDVTIKPYI